MIEPAIIHADPLGLLVAFGAGMLSFLSPCVLPLVPAYLSMVSGLSAAELSALGSPRTPALVPVAVTARNGSPPLAEGMVAEGALAEDRAPEPAALSPSDLRRQRERLLRGILAFIAGFTLIFVILGASASAIGRLFLTHQQVLETVSGILIVIFGVYLVAAAAGVGMPMALSGERRFIVRPSVLGAWAPPVMGMAFAFAWTPCIGPVLGSVLTLAAGTGGSTEGGIALLLAYSLGLGVPFLLTGLAFGRMTDALARVRSHLRVVDLIGGAVLVIFGVLLLTHNVAILSDHISNWLRDLHLSRLSTS
jgi:cytochrome c-type biogenesis protein